MIDPYESPTNRTDSKQGSDGAEDEHPLYPLILKMVLWGEPREEAFHRMEVNGLPSAVAKQIYLRASAERIRTIRSRCTRTMLVGASLLLGAGAVFSVFWLGVGFIPNFLLYGCLAASGIGAWRLIDGAARYLMAPGKEGSIAGEE